MRRFSVIALCSGDTIAAWIDAGREAPSTTSLLAFEVGLRGGGALSSAAVLVADDGRADTLGLVRTDATGRARVSLPCDSSGSRLCDVSVGLFPKMDSNLQIVRLAARCGASTLTVLHGL
jgi:hypothetical protein